MSRLVSIHMLQLFVRVADTGTITAAAREFDMSPSIASRQIVALERALKTKLINRTTRRLSLTEAGKTLLEWARDASKGFEQIADELGAIQHRPSGLIRLVTNDYAAVSFLPILLRKFGDKYPEIRIQMSILNDPLALLGGGYDLALHTGRMPSVNLVGRKINNYPRLLCASPKYLARRGRPKTLDDLAEHDCLVHSLSERSHWSFSYKGEIITKDIDPYMEVDSYLALTEMTAAGLGIARISDVLFARQAKGLEPILTEYKCVYPDGGLPASWLIFPDRRILFRTRLLADFLAGELTTLRRKGGTARGA